MPPIKREEILREGYIRLDIPQYILLYERAATEVIGPYDPDFFLNYQEQRAKSEREATVTLEAMSDAELLDLFGSHGGRLVFELEHSLRDHPPWHAGGFAVCADADFKLWCNFEYWSLHEATCLSIGFPPDELSDDPDPGWFHRPYPSMEFFRNRRETLRRAMGAIGLGDDRVSPKAFARWAAKVDLEVPDALLVCLRGGEKSLSPAMLSTVDGRKLGSAQKVVLGLVAEGLGSNGAVTEETMAEAAQWVKAGLDRLGLTLDPKTIKRTLSDAKSQLSRLQADQSKKDESGE